MKIIARGTLILAGAIWGMGFIGNKYILDSGWSETQLLFVRFTSAFVVIFIMYAKKIIKTNKNTVNKGLVLGSILFCGFLFQTIGLKYTTASNNALITAGYVVLLPIIIVLVDKTKVSLKSICASLITFLGLAIVSFNFNTMQIGFGDAITFVGTFFWAIYIYFLGKSTKKYDLMQLLAFQLLIFTLFSTSLVITTDGLPDPNPNLWFIAILLGIGASFVAFWLQAFGQKHTSSDEAAILISTESIFGPIFAICFYNELFSNKLLIGMVCVTIGIYLSIKASSIFDKRTKHTE